MASQPARRRGIIPNDLRQRIDQATPEFALRSATRMLSHSLDGIAPSALTDEERVELLDTWGELGERAFTILEQVGYGTPRPRRSRSERAHGLRRERRLRGVIGKLPRALALRLPTTAENHRHGEDRNDGRDRWGKVSCSRTLRADHLGLIAAAGGLWAARARGGETWVDCTAGELVQLLEQTGRIGGKQVARIHRLLSDLEQLQLSADVAERTDKPGSDAHRIPEGPIAKIERRLGDRWLPSAEYLAASAAAAAGTGEDLLESYDSEHAPCEGIATIRIHLADWVIAALAHQKLRPVYIDFAVWAHLRPSARRTYAFVQALGRDDYDGRIYFYLAPPTLYTLGITTRRLDRAGNAVSEDLTALWHADSRYHDGNGFRRHTHADTNIPAFGCDAARKPSCATDTARATKAPPRRPGALRGAARRLRRYAITASRAVEDGQLDPGAVARLGLDAARREHQLVRDAIQNSRIGAAATSREPGPFESSHATRHRRTRTSPGRDEDPAA
jgi:hypothetical protein